jgi:hypothetical protein
MYQVQTPYSFNAIKKCKLTEISEFLIHQHSIKLLMVWCPQNVWILQITDKRIKPCLKNYVTVRQTYQRSLGISGNNGINILGTKHAMIEAEHICVCNSQCLSTCFVCQKVKMMVGTYKYKHYLSLGRKLGTFLTSAVTCMGLSPSQLLSLSFPWRKQCHNHDDSEYCCNLQEIT